MHISSYRFGEILIDGIRYQKDLKILKGVAIPNWWRAEGHLVSLADVEDVADAAPHTLIVGTGASGQLRLDTELAAQLGARGIRVESLPTEFAVHRFEELSSQLGLDAVAAALHLTC